MSESKSPVDRALELFVFGPAGLAITAAEEFPKLVEKGRHRVEGQVHMARLVGQFAVQMGRRQIEQTVERLTSSTAASPAPASSEGRAPRAQGRVAASRTVAAPTVEGAPLGTTATVETTTGASPHTDDSGTGATGTPGAELASAPGAGAASGNGAASPGALAIPGYDSLSASQVVQRLDGLSAAELEEVGTHEAANRHRRTILNRVEQLLAGADAERR